MINTVGPGAPGTFEDLTDEQWRRSVENGVLGMGPCVRSALPLLGKAQWAPVVNFSAHSTQRQSVMLPAYTAAKSMLTSVSKAPTSTSTADRTSPEFWIAWLTGGLDHGHGK